MWDWAAGLVGKLWDHKRIVIPLAIAGFLGYRLIAHPPVETLGHDEIGVRINRITGGAKIFHEGSVVVLPRLHELRRYSRDYVVRPVPDGAAPFQSQEGLPLDVALVVRYALDFEQLAKRESPLPESFDAEIVEPAVRVALQRYFGHHTVKEIFETQRAELQTLAETEVGPRLAADAIVLRGIEIGGVDVPALHDRVYVPAQGGEGAETFQSSDGLSIGVALTIRYALDPDNLARLGAVHTDDVDAQVVQPVVQGAIYKILTRYTVKEIFSSKRAEIQETIESDLEPKLAAEGVLLRSVQMGRVDMPPEYRAGMERALAEELETEKMKHTLVLKDQQVKQSALEAEAEKVRREKAAQAAASEQVIAAKAQEEAMKHVLPFKQKQIEQRKLEAEAEKLSRIRTAEGNAEARRIEAAGEADSRRKLTDADVYRTENLGKVTSAQLERDGQALSRHPLLVQKTMADKLSDKVQVIIAAPPVNGGFIGSTLLGQGAKPMTAMGDDQ